MDNNLKIPQHLAIIPDGNGRWAKMRHMPRSYGHTQGSKNVETICEEAFNLGVKYLTFYAFSTENWVRPEDEVKALMGLLRQYLKDCVRISNKNDMRVRVIGDISRLDKDMQESIIKLQDATKLNKGLNFQVALNYGGRDEIIRAIKRISNACKNNDLNVEDINENTISENLDTAGIPDPDLLIRTSGEQRISNFMLWQLSYTEFYFPTVLWPDFDKKELKKAIEYYNSRDRRYGGT